MTATSSSPAADYGVKANMFQRILISLLCLCPVLVGCEQPANDGLDAEPLDTGASESDSDDIDLDAVEHDVGEPPKPTRDATSSTSTTSDPWHACYGNAADPFPPHSIDPDPIYEEPSTGNADDFTFGGTARGVIEVGAAWEQRDIRVCFKGSGYGGDRTFIRDVIQSSWGRLGGVRLTSWGTCAGVGDGDISIELDSLGLGGRSEFGTASMDAYPSMNISVEFPSAQCVPTVCDETIAPNGRTRRQNCIAGIALHEFGHALGFRHEHIHPDSTCTAFSGKPELLDQDGLNGEPIDQFDDDSIMSYCMAGSMSPKLSFGDIKQLNTLYPRQVVAYRDSGFRGTSQPFAWGQWRDCAGQMNTVPGSQISSLVVPQGMRARVCNTSGSCLLLDNSADLPFTHDGRVASITVEARVPMYGAMGLAGPFFDSFPPGIHRSSTDALFFVGNDNISSMVVGPNLSVRLCENELFGLGGGVCYTQTGNDPFSHVVPPQIDNETSFVQIRTRIATYRSAQYLGDMESYGHGTYRASDGSLESSVSSLAIPTGLEIRACTSEGTGNGGGTCGVFRKSVAQLNATFDDEIEFMHVRSSTGTTWEPPCLFNPGGGVFG